MTWFAWNIRTPYVCTMHARELKRRKKFLELEKCERTVFPKLSPAWLEQREVTCACGMESFVPPRCQRRLDFLMEHLQHDKSTIVKLLPLKTTKVFIL